jgi:DNA-binding response OmpR family regulator
MAFKTAFSDKRILILDDMAEMRSALRSQIGSLGCENVSLSANVQDAMGQLNARAFDIILCDFYLGSGADGQQFLEFLRTRKLISHSALFLMITAEKRYETVVTTAECLPDDYLLKPFTAHALTVRLERLLEKKARLAQVDLLQDQDNWPGVISACDDIIATRDRYLFDAMRIKGQALLAAQRFADALIHYQQIIEVRPLPWARLGLARALRHSGETARSKETLTALITEAPQLMAAYDLLGELHAAAGEHHEALAVLDSASLVSPNSLTRNRAIAAVAERQGDYARVKRLLAWSAGPATRRCARAGITRVWGTP